MSKMNVLNLIRALNGETQHKNKKGRGKGCFGKNPKKNWNKKNDSSKTN